ncbi:uncharacterized protein EV422DRAFT_506845 [Fimicolochytrium jonesii]|uniref:uncharacterized protein n=1 Tax=Fimicolochytrium jonesii TaxID=1396493 RepID=UPI0022FEFBA8|nr:uncharacterized protein EV422DRAFT_506845 [Fimicolochytrium jonesii]KAI8820110.1 hypothetical protein EV422DRAFT_506845 [Fimicolochytrium jonesii]
MWVFHIQQKPRNPSDAETADDRTIILTDWGIDIINMKYIPPIPPLAKPRMAAPTDRPVYNPSKHKALPPTFPRTVRYGTWRNACEVFPPIVVQTARKSTEEWRKRERELTNDYVLRYLKPVPKRKRVKKNVMPALKEEQIGVSAQSPSSMSPIKDNARIATPMISAPAIREPTLNIATQPDTVTTPRDHAPLIAKSVTNAAIPLPNKAQTPSQVALPVSPVVSPSTHITAAPPSPVKQIAPPIAASTESIAVTDSADQLASDSEEDDEWLQQEKERLYSAWGRQESTVAEQTQQLELEKAAEADLKASEQRAVGHATVKGGAGEVIPVASPIRLKPARDSEADHVVRKASEPVPNVNVTSPSLGRAAMAESTLHAAAVSPGSATIAQHPISNPAITVNDDDVASPAIPEPITHPHLSTTDPDEPDALHGGDSLADLGFHRRSPTGSIKSLTPSVLSKRSSNVLSSTKHTVASFFKKSRDSLKESEEEKRERKKVERDEKEREKEVHRREKEEAKRAKAEEKGKKKGEKGEKRSSLSIDKLGFHASLARRASRSTEARGDAVEEKQTKHADAIEENEVKADVSATDAIESSDTTPLADSAAAKTSTEALDEQERRDRERDEMRRLRREQRAKEGGDAGPTSPTSPQVASSPARDQGVSPGGPTTELTAAEEARRKQEEAECERMEKEKEAAEMAEREKRAAAEAEKAVAEQTRRAEEERVAAAAAAATARAETERQERQRHEQEVREAERCRQEQLRLESQDHERRESEIRDRKAEEERLEAERRIAAAEVQARESKEREDRERVAKEVAEREERDRAKKEEEERVKVEAVRQAKMKAEAERLEKEDARRAAEEEALREKERERVEQEAAAAAAKKAEEKKREDEEKERARKKQVEEQEEVRRREEAEQQAAKEREAASAAAARKAEEATATEKARKDAEEEAERRDRERDEERRRRKAEREAEAEREREREPKANAASPSAAPTEPVAVIVTPADTPAAVPAVHLPPNASRFLNAMDIQAIKGVQPVSRAGDEPAPTAIHANTSASTRQSFSDQGAAAAIGSSEGSLERPPMHVPETPKQSMQSLAPAAAAFKSVSSLASMWGGGAKARAGGVDAGRSSVVVVPGNPEFNAMVTWKNAKLELKVVGIELHCLEAGKNKQHKHFFPLELRRILSAVASGSDVVLHACTPRKGSKPGSKLKKITFTFTEKTKAAAWSEAIMGTVYGGAEPGAITKGVLVLVDKHEKDAAKVVEKYSVQFNEFSVSNTLATQDFSRLSNILILNNQDFTPRLQQVLVRNQYVAEPVALAVDGADPVDAALAVLRSNIGKGKAAAGAVYVTGVTLKREEGKVAGMFKAFGK